MSVTLTGTITTFIFQNKENNYKIFVIADENLNRYTLCGYVLELQDDLIYDFICEETNHPKYGQQYKILSYQVHKDTSREGIITYLSSNLFPGVGLITAESIYDTLGEKCLELIEKDPTVLDAVPKVSKIQKSILYQKILENRVIEGIFVRLYQIGLSSKMVMDLFEKYHENTLEIIEENPYRLMYDLDGVGFKKADEFALKLGFSYDSSERLKALLIFTMGNVCNHYGLTYLTKEQLLSSSYQYGLKNTNVSIEFLEKQLSLVIMDGKIIVENERFYVPSIYYAEVKIANKLNQIMATPTVKVKQNMLNSFLKDFEKINNISLAKEQEEAICVALKNKVSIVTGGPGTGKTTILKAILQIYCGLHGFSPFDDDAVGHILLCAPTGKAAKRINEQALFKASTIHKALGYNFDSEFAFNGQNPLPQHLIIIDETSMIDTILAAHLLDAISINAQIVFVGDVFQLPSIGPGAFLKDLIDSKVIPTTYLKTIYRQGDGSSIVELAEGIKEGKVDPSIFEGHFDLKYIPVLPNQIENAVLETIESFQKAGYNLEDDIQVLAPMYKGVGGIDALNRSISDTFNKNYSYEVHYKDKIFKEHDKVIQLTNSNELQIMNGDIGKIMNKELLAVEDKDKEIYKIDFFERSVKISDKDFENLKLAYAISIHKSQGSEYPVVILPMLRSYYVMLKRKLIYTAVTRAKEKLVIVGDLNAFYMGLAEIEANRQTSLAIRLCPKPKRKLITDPEIPFDDLGEENMEGITPYSFMV